MDVSTRLLSLVGAALTDLHGCDLHDAFPWWQAATESPQLVAGRWLSAEPLTMSKHLVVWVLVDRTAELSVAAVRAALSLDLLPSLPNPAVRMLLQGYALQDITTALDLSRDRT